MTAATAMTREQAELAILRKYAAGAEIATIERDLGVNREQIAEVCGSINYQRGRAQELLRQREAALMKARTTPAAPSSPHREPTRTSGNALVGPGFVVEPAAGEEVAAASSSRTPAATFSTDDMPILEVLARAEEIPRLKTRALRLRALVDDLRRDLSEAWRVAEAERRVDQLRDQLAQATNELKAMKTPPVPGRAVEVAPAETPSWDPKEVRAWAAANGIDVNASGRVRKDVVALYVAAHPDAA